MHACVHTRVCKCTPACTEKHPGRYPQSVNHTSFQEVRIQVLSSFYLPGFSPPGMYHLTTRMKTRKSFSLWKEGHRAGAPPSGKSPGEGWGGEIDQFHISFTSSSHPSLQGGCLAELERAELFPSNRKSD